MKDDRLYLVHIKESIERVEEYIAQGKEVFRNDRKGQDAVLRNLHTLTESAMRLSDDVKAACPEVDWRGIAAFRNVVVHDYLGLDWDQIWLIVERDLPSLKGCVLEVLGKLSST